MSSFTLSTISVPEAVGRFSDGKPVVVVDQSAEPLGDLAFPAELVSVENMLQLVAVGGGIVYALVPESQCERLNLPRQVKGADDPNRWQSENRVLVEARNGVTTGISAHDRTRTVRVVSDPGSSADDVVVPGHVVSYAARPGGTLERAGIAEASVDLARLAGLWPAAADAEILNPDGSRARGADLLTFGTARGIPLIESARIAHYRRSLEPGLDDSVSC